MSLYDLYYSDKNKEHMYQLLYKVTQNKLDSDTFICTLNDVFEITNKDNLLELNKELFEEICKIYKIESLENTNQIVDIKNNNNSIKNYDNTINNKENNISNISSINKLEGNRFNYKIKLDTKINKINKMIIPIEDNELFINNTLKLYIPELNIDTICFCSDIKNIKNRDYGTYIVDKLCDIDKIDIISIIIKGTIYNNDHSDIIEITKNEDDYIVTNNEGILVGDMLKSSDDNVFKVIDIIDNKITLNKPFNEDKLEFINLNLQNIFIYEY